jgi:hypothetical protein
MLLLAKIAEAAGAVVVAADLVLWAVSSVSGLCHGLQMP